MDTSRSDVDCLSLPVDNRELAGVTIDLPLLDDDSPASSPVRIGDLLGYLTLEVPGGGLLTVDDLVFRRTADLGDVLYWIWSFHEPDGGAAAYATVAQSSNGIITMCYDANEYGTLT